ncbi:MAG: ribonuclease E inhibitor RraB [Erysipelotrichaceae bacterium]|nr:ribonuclease E inhibitor RraB [Erysipelotrichaceae bacterium]
MKKLLSILAVTTAAAAVVAGGAYIAKKLEEQKDEEVRLIEIKNNDEDVETSEDDEASEEDEDSEEEEEPEIEVSKEDPTEEVKEEETKEENLSEEIEPTTVEETVEPVVEEPVENKYPSISERKINAIKKQIGVMIEAMPDESDVRLQHYVVFPTKEAADAFYEEMNTNEYEIEVENEGTEVSLIKDYQLISEELETEILSLAEFASEHEGVYKGWAVKVK